MKIGELAKLTGLATSRIPLLRGQRPDPLAAQGQRLPRLRGRHRVDPGAGHRRQGAGFSLEEIARLLPSGDGAWQHGELLEGLRRKVAVIEALQRRLEQNKAQLLVAIESIENKPDGLQCTENTQRVLERLREEGPPQTVGRPRQTRSRGPLPRRRSSGFPTLDLEVDLNLRVTPTHPDSPSRNRLPTGSLTEEGQRNDQAHPHVVTKSPTMPIRPSPPGCGLSELTHAYEIFAALGATSNAWSAPAAAVAAGAARPRLAPRRRQRQGLAGRRDAPGAAGRDTAAPEQVDAEAFDAIYFTGGHGVM